MSSKNIKLGALLKNSFGNAHKNSIF